MIIKQTKNGPTTVIFWDKSGYSFFTNDNLYDIYRYKRHKFQEN